MAVPIVLRESPGGPRRTFAARDAHLPCVVLYLLSLATFLTLFVLRARDDNRLTSWQWVFGDADVFRIAPILLVALLLAYALARMPLPRRYPARLLFVLSFAVGAMTWSEPEVIVDVARYFTQAKHVELHGVGYFLAEWGGRISAWTDLPLVPLLYGLIFSLFGEERIFVQVFTTLLFAGTVVLTFLIGKTLWDTTMGLFAGALLLGMPYLLAQVPLMLVDVPTMFFLTLAVFLVLRAAEHGGIGLLMAAAVAVALAFCTKYSSWLMLSVLPVIFIARHGSWQRAAALVAISLALIGAFLGPNLDVILGQLEILQSYQAPGLRRWEESFTSTFLFQTHPFIAGAALFSIYAACKRRDASYAIVLWLPLLLVLLEIKRIRYLLPAFPMLALMASYGLREIRDLDVRKYAVLCIMASSVVTMFFGFLPFARQVSAANLQQAGGYIDSLEGSGVEVIALPQLHAHVNPAVSVPILDLFTVKRLVYRDAAVVAPAARTLAESSLRFTWEQQTPAYYAVATDDPGKRAVVVIASDPAQLLPATIGQRLQGYRLSRAFVAAENIYGYRTIVQVYLPVQQAPQG